MQTSPRSRSVRLTVAALAAAPLLAGCGFNVQTDHIYQPGVGVNDRAGAVDVLAAVVVADKAGQGTLLATLVNNNQSKADKLSSVSSPNAQVSATPTNIPAEGSVNLAQTGGLQMTGTPTPGGYVTVTFTFANAQAATLNVPVVDATGEYATFAPGSAAATAPSATASPATKKSKKAGSSNPTMPSASATPTK